MGQRAWGWGNRASNCMQLEVLFEGAEGWRDVGLRRDLHFFFKVGAITAYLYTDGNDPAGKGS